MVVHSTPTGALEGTMQTCPSPETLPIEAGDVEWVAGLFDTMRAGDLDAVAEQLDEVAHRVRKAAKARRMLATVDQRLLADGLALHHSRTEAAQ
jgi:hypothetical protein